MKLKYVIQFGIAVILVIVLNVITLFNVNVAQAHAYPHYAQYDCPGGIFTWARCETGADNGCEVAEQFPCF